MNPLAEDLHQILHLTRGLWDELRNRRLFITGGTGFFGCWLLESFAWANDHLNLNAHAVVLSRNPDAFRAKAPHLAARADIQLHPGDVRDFPFPPGEFTHVIHAATDASVTLIEQQPLQMFDTIANGTRRVLDFAVQSGARKVLLTSSGAVYGPQPPTLTHVPEDYLGAPDPIAPRSSYGEGKRVSELLCAIYAKQHGIETKIARCFAFVGPHLPLDGAYAAGNFIRDGLQGRPIQISGDGTALRSYLYASDLAIWLWTILFRGASARPYNVGSEAALSIAELARIVAANFNPAPEIRIAQKPNPAVPPARYVPATTRARTELSLTPTIDPCAAIAKTIAWHKRVAPL